MASRWMIAVAVLLGGCAHAPGGARGTEHTALSDDDEQAIRDLLAAQRDAWNRGDLAGFMAGYEQTPELSFVSGTAIRRGWNETRDRYRDRYGSDQSGMGTLAFDIRSIRDVGRDGALVIGEWRLRDSPHDGGGIFSLVLVRTAGGWRIRHDHTAAYPEGEVNRADGRPPELLLGEFVDDYGVRYRVSEEEWLQRPSGRYRIVKWDASQKFLIAQNGDDNPSDAGLWTRIDWMEFPESESYRWAFCMSAYKARDAASAERAAVADRSTPKTGCNGFPFSRMRRSSEAR